MHATYQVVFASAVFLGTYALLIADKIHRTVVALCGAVLILLAGIITQERAVRAIDFNTIGLLIGMMVIVGITRTRWNRPSSSFSPACSWWWARWTKWASLNT